MTSRNKLVDAIYYAATCHANQRRKDRAGTPYINHPLQVLQYLTTVGVTDEEVLCAAVLHDVVEDTNGTLLDIHCGFGEVVRDLVGAVTDDKSLPKVERKKQQIEHAAKLGYGARLIKLADKLANLQNLHCETPQGWSPQIRKGYVYWALAVVDKLRGTNKLLEEWLDAIFALLNVDAKGITQRDLEDHLFAYYQEIQSAERHKNGVE